MFVSCIFPIGLSIAREALAASGLMVVFTIREIIRVTGKKHALKVVMS
jgi:hypothetical protein